MNEIDALVGEIKLKRDHQVRAVRAALDALLVRKQRGVVFADEVGCGKTYEALATAALLWKHHESTGVPIRRILIVAEKALITKWFDEIEASPDKGRGFQQYVQTPEFKPFVTMLQGATQLESRRAGDGSGERVGGKVQVRAGVYLAKPLVVVGGKVGDTAPVVRWLKQTDWDLVIADEAHHFTGLNTERSRVFFPDRTVESRSNGLSSRYTLALTATPFQLATAEMLNLLRIVNAIEGDVQLVAEGLVRFENALEQFYARRRLSPTDDARRRWVDRLDALRRVDASGGARAGTPGLQELLRRYFIRNVRDTSERDYFLSEQHAAGYEARAFRKLDDVRPLLGSSPLLRLTGDDAWVYFQLRDLLVDADRAARAAKGTQTVERPSFIAGDLRQCLSSYHQLADSAVLKKALPRAELTKATVTRLLEKKHRHPKIRAICAVVSRILDQEIAICRAQAGRNFHKILVFNCLMKTASALRDALLETVAEKVDPFVNEQLAEAGWGDIDEARGVVRDALRIERETARERLNGKFDPRFLRITKDMLAYTNLVMSDESRELVDVMFDRAEEHCTQPLFLLRMSRWLRFADETPSVEAVQSFLMKHVGEKLHKSIDMIVDDYLDDTPRHGEKFSEENLDRARREIARVTRVLAAPKYVARFDGDQSEPKREMRRENFNRPYSPLVLLVSKVGEEGIDLQHHTRYVLHYDVEWNPAKMEQREGRVDREGRRTTGAVQVQFFLLKDTYEERIFHTVMQRDAWFQVLIGSKRIELAKGVDDEDEQPSDAEIGELESGRLTAEERERVMIDLRP